MLHVADAGSVAGFEKHGILTVEERFFQRTFANIVVQRSSSPSQKQGQRFPAFEQTVDGFAEDPGPVQ
jgi:hypothetical protein